MKKHAITVLMLVFIHCFSIAGFSQNIGINPTGTAPDSSAMLDVQSTTKGMLIPRMTSAQRAAILLPATGLLVFDNTTSSFWFKSKTRWVELVDSTNTIWTKKDANVYLNNSENVGIGTTSPETRLHINNGTDVGAVSGGYLQLGASTNPNLAFDNNEIQARNNGSPANLTMQLSGGNLGIGAGSPDAKLQVSNGTDAGASSGGYLQLGALSSTNLAFDNNEIQARNNGAVSTLFLQNNGGNLQVGAAAGSTTDVHINNGKLLKPATGNFNMMPLCYGNVSFDGSASATPNVTVSKGNRAGEYFITSPDITASTVTMASLTGILVSGTTISMAYISQPVHQVEVFIYDIITGTGFNTDFFFIFYNP